MVLSWYKFIQDYRQNMVGYPPLWIYYLKIRNLLFQGISPGSLLSIWTCHWSNYGSVSTISLRFDTIPNVSSMTPTLDLCMS